MSIEIFDRICTELELEAHDSGSDDSAYYYDDSVSVSYNAEGNYITLIIAEWCEDDDNYHYKTFVTMQSFLDDTSLEIEFLKQLLITTCEWYSEIEYV